MLSPRRAMYFLAALASAGCDGGGRHRPSPIAVPQNVAATAGYETATLAWDAVAGATGYRVYVATSPGVDLATLTPTEIAAPPLVETALANWQTRYYRVAALVGTREGDPSAEVTATPEGGYLISERKNGSNYDVFVYRSDAIEMGPVESVAGARLLESIGDPKIGTAWGVPSGAKYSRFGIFTSSTPLVLGEQASHLYEFIDLIPSVVPRLAWVDCGATCDVMSSLLDGTDVRTLHTGCTDIAVDELQPTINPKVSTSGLAFRCTTAGVREWWFTDGVAAAFKLDAPLADDTRTLEALTANRAIFAEQSLRHLTTQALAPATIESNLLEPDQARYEHDLLRRQGRDSFSGRLLVRRYDNLATGIGRYELRTVNDDGTDQDIEIASYGLPSLMDVSPDGLRFLARILQKDALADNDEVWGFAFSSNPTGDQVSFTDGNGATAGDDGIDAKFTADGKVAINHVTDAWDIFEPTGALIPFSDVTPDSNYSWAGTKGSWFFVSSVSGGQLIASKSDGTLATVAPTVPYPVPVAHRSDGILLFVDANRDAWSSVYNPTSGLFEASAIDAVETLQVQEVGDGPGSRTFLVMQRYNGGTPHTDLVVYDIANRASPAEPLLATTADETGFFVAD